MRKNMVVSFFWVKDKLACVGSATYFCFTMQSFPIHTFDLQFMGVPQSIASYAIEAEGGVILVEVGPHSTFPVLEQGLRDLGFSIHDVKAVFLSHIHFDHAGAAWAFAEAGATIYVHPKGLPHLHAPEKLYQSASMIYGPENMLSLWGEMRPIPMEQLYAPQHGETIEVAGLRFTAWYTPGHAVHHIAWEVTPVGGGQIADSPRVLFTGDVAGIQIDGRLAIPPCPPPDIHVEDWRASIALLRERPVDRFYLTHFGLSGEKTALLDELEARLVSWSEWIKPFAEQKIPAEEVVPQFEAFVMEQFAGVGLTDFEQQQYSIANPAFMSVAGLMRYWKKRMAE